jgi:hypothetical protein
VLFFEGMVFPLDLTQLLLALLELELQFSAAQGSWLRKLHHCLGRSPYYAQKLLGPLAVLCHSLFGLFLEVVCLSDAKVPSCRHMLEILGVFGSDQSLIPEKCCICLS